MARGGGRTKALRNEPLMVWLGLEGGEGGYAAWQAPGETPGDGAYLGHAGPAYPAGRIWGARYLADDGWLDPVGINDPDADGSTPSLALAPDGTALVAWLADDDPFDEVLQVWARVLAADFWGR